MVEMKMRPHSFSLLIVFGIQMDKVALLLLSDWKHETFFLGGDLS